MARKRQRESIKIKPSKRKKPFNEKNKKEFLEECEKVIDRTVFIWEEFWKEPRQVNRNSIEKEVWEAAEQKMRDYGWHEDLAIRNVLITRIKKYIERALG